MDPARIMWETNLERRYPYGPVSPDPDRFEPLGFPPPWPARPWIYANFIVSRNGIGAWKRQGPQDDPIRVIAGGDFSRPGRRADVRHMRYLRASADAVSVGGQTLRDQPRLTMTLDEPGDGAGDALSRFRAKHGLRHQPLQILYTHDGVLDLGARIFNTPGLEALHRAGMVDELFLTETDVVIGPAEHEAVKRLFGVEGARLIAEGHTASDAAYVFRRWRFNER